MSLPEEISLRVGRIPFLVCAPFFHASLAGLPGIRFTDGTPRALNGLLASGAVDCAPSSSFEYARNPDLYRLLPGLCTSGKGEVKSVLFFSRHPWESLQGRPVRLSADSDTSNALFQVLSRFKFGMAPECVAPGRAEDSVDGQVLIGDAALRETGSGRWPFRYDLAEVWESWQGTRLPFGLWMVRAETWAGRRPAVLGYHEHLRRSLATFFADPPSALAAWSRTYALPLPLAEALAFFPTADYELGSGHEEALRVFFDLSREAGLLRVSPPLRFARE